ncbi:hypothetical protein N1851_001474 [Merluccius polli]|uniref:Uncharacterized protein n=1 Tax=Merluccius polli TaxID=89951 RepID=A0AA47PDP9_MERPO|nr:hypothetical protein N1851_001474 [Merluccius polli]
MKISAGKDVNLPTDTAPVEDSPLNTSDAAGRESENTKAPLQVMQQPSLLLGSVSPEMIRNLPAVFPPSPLPRRSQCGLRGNASLANQTHIRKM